MAKKKKKTTKKEDEKELKKSSKKTIKKASKKESKKEKKNKKSKALAVVPKKEAPKVKKTKKKASKKSVPFLTWIKNQMASLLLLIFAFVTLLFVGAIAYINITMPVKIADVVPATDTAMIIDFNARRSPLAAYTNKRTYQFDFTDVITLVEEAFSADFDEDIKPWLGYSHGYALTQVVNEDQTKKYEHILFVESIDPDKTLEFMRRFELASLRDNLIEESYKDFTLYTYEVGQNIYFMRLDSYFVFTHSKQALLQVVDTFLGERDPLSSLDDYKKVRSNVNKDIGFMYSDPLKVYDYLTEGVIPETGSVVRPVLSLLDAVGNSIILKKDALIVQTYVQFESKLKESESYELRGKYKAELFNVLPEGYAYAYGSRDISRQLSEIGDIMNQLHPASYSILEGMLNAKKEEYFETDIDLVEDIYPVLSDEFIIALYEDEDYIDQLFIARNQIEEDIKGLEGSYFNRMSERGYRVISGSKVEGITSLPFNVDHNLYTAFVNGTYVYSTNLELVTETRELLTNGAIMGDVDSIHSYLEEFSELSKMDPDFMATLLGSHSQLFLDNFSSISSAKHIFLDGMAIVHVFEF